ncbi:hypothetical protein [Lelliottia wanjuensis]|uniref:Uncharacterized protein n=1 Tax=Lelliottia wanjuensis TaxID=3050585 RepID=A0AAP4D4J3_9ENTR|nr:MULTISPECIES: hypothetical protein [unclassified Lelliottia]MDK9363347.1 hypothetical protein [Lelliottia sp. V106_12]MDK9585581.1 hypothetical protein [Lelliottia sp. V86_10]MDK9616989.1 hypothetical protein [Lelliottia sp. V106_9]
MTTYARTRAMHQYYRDVFTREIYLPEADALPAHIVVEILNYANADLRSLEGMLNAAETELDPDQDRAIKLMMSAVALANGAFDSRSDGQQVPLSAETIALITSQVVEAMQLSNSVHFLVASIQILFRVNEIDSVLFLITNNLSTLSEIPSVLKILLLICLMEEDYNQALVIVQQLTANADLIGEDRMTLIMVVCSIYKLGGFPDSFIDFRPLSLPAPKLDASRYEWLIAPEDNGKTTVMVACDKGYYYQHAVALLLSIYETNGSDLNVHFHIYNCDAEMISHLQGLGKTLPGLNLSLSSEYFAAVQAVNVHYACRRFIFLSHALEKINGPIMVLDADCLVRKSWAEVKARYQDNELIVSHHDGLPLWEQIPAGFVYTRGGAISKKYFAAVGHFIDVNLASEKAEWFLDQIALSFSVDALTPVEQMSIGREPTAELIDIKHSDNAFSWVVTTSKNAAGRYQDYKKQLCSKYLPDA